MYARVTIVNSRSPCTSQTIVVEVVSYLPTIGYHIIEQQGFVDIDPADGAWVRLC